MKELRRSVRYVLAVMGATALATVGSAPVGHAAVPGPRTDLTVTAITPAAGDVVGVAAPVEVTFAEPVTNRARAEKSIDIESAKTPTGQFTWLSNQVVQWVPDHYWPAHSPISVTADGFSTSFETGSAVVGVADISAHTFTVSIDDQVVRQMPASMGKSKYPTPIGSFTALAKENPVIMDSRTIGIPLSDPEGYKLTVYDAVRVTWGGVYVHSAPWSVGSQGNSNVSHGCINLSPDNADWYYNTVRIGDPIIVQA
ncbi:L,D-transpeptidase [Mycolicibacterium moriokaense]|nr:L,D-transpeptidase [Mycolicibacterium moriokaense]